MRYLQDPLAKEIIKGTFRPGDIILVERKGDELAFSPKRATGRESVAAVN
jgi:hypothetical protein